MPVLKATPNIPIEKVVFTTTAQIEISATAKEVFDAVVDFEHYSEWNTWTKRVVFDTPTPNVGDEAHMDVYMKPGKKMVVPIKVS